MNITLPKFFQSKQSNNLTKNQRRFAYISITPIMLYLGFFTLLPVLWVVVLSFFSYSPIREGSGFLGLGGANPFIGFDNFIELAIGTSQPAVVFRYAFMNTFMFAAFVLPLNLLITLPLAVLLESIGSRWKNIFRAIYFLPAISSAISVVIIWGNIYGSPYGLLSQMIRFVGLVPPKSWLSDPNAVYFGVPLAMLCVVVMHVWQDFGFNLVIFVAALQSVPQTLREAARIDGANAFQELWLILLPLLRRTILLTSVLTTLSSVQVFVPFQLLTRGGPRHETTVMLLSIYDNAFRFANQLGLAAAMSMVLFIIMLTLTVLQFRMLRTEWDY